VLFEEQLDSHFAAQIALPPTEDDAHAAPADLALQVQPGLAPIGPGEQPVCGRAALGHRVSFSGGKVVCLSD
jgi:hypothetical protein